MFKLAIVGTVAALATAKHHPINDDIVAQVKSKAKTWVAHEAHENPLKDMSLGEIYGLLGTKKVDAVGDYPAPEVNAGLPDNFDSRTQWPDCVHAIRDQQ
jgi:hypothetical protein